jgi:alpha-N-arabinofuranosidase
MFQFDAQQLKVIGEERLLINGGTDMAKKPVWIEAPHIIKKDGWYYLICAEGGTAYNHSEVVFRSKSLSEPFVSYEKNPILTQRHLNPNRSNPITTTGHADFVEGKNGKWWGVFLGCRPYEGDFYNTGRETFMAPVVWKNGWPEFELGGDEVKFNYPIKAIADKTRELFNGNYTFRDEFDQDLLKVRYQFLRTIRFQWFSLTDQKGALALKLQPITCADKANPSFIGFHQPHLKGSVSTSLQFTPISYNEKAGLLLFQNENNYYFLCKSIKDGKPVVALYKGDSLLVEKNTNSKVQDKIDLKVVSNGPTYTFYFATEQNAWKLLLDNVDAKYLSTKIAGGFVGTVYAMYASSHGKPSDTKALYHWFEVKNDDDVYK